MAPELEDYWFERTGRGCRARVTGWQGRLLIALYTLVATAAAAWLVDRSIALMLLSSAIFLWIAAAKTRGGLGW